MKHSEKNLAVIQNFILHITHCDNFEAEIDFKEEMEFTPETLYQMANDYIDEDHADGKENPEDHIVTYGAESSYQTEDRNKEHKEYVVIVADFGDEVGTQTVATFNDIENLKAIQDFLEFIKCPLYQ